MPIRLSDQETAVVNDLLRVLRAPAADAAYDQIPGTFDGKLLNADLARELSRDYRAKYDRIAFTACTYPPCSAYVRKRFDAAITRPGTPGERAVLFLAGGAASGKTRSVKTELLDDFELVFDSNLADFEKACEMVDSALKHFWLVQIIYIHRPYELALRGMLERAMEDGLYIPVGPPSKLARLHFNAQRTILRLREAFPADVVRINVLENLYQPDNPVKAKPVPLNDLAPGDRSRYHSLEELHAIQTEIIEEFKTRIEEGLLQALRETEG